MNVAEYASKFSTLLKYAPHVATNAKVKYNRFVNGLHPAIYTFVISCLPTSYTEAVERAKAAEAGLKRGGPQYNPPLPVTAQQPTLRPRGRKFKKIGSTVSSSSSSSSGSQRGSPQSNVPRYRGPGGQSAQVPPQVRMYAMTEDQAKYALGGVIAGVATYALLDSGAIQSFISETFVKRLGIIPEALDLGFRVSIPSGDQMFTSQIVKSLELLLQKNMRSVSVQPPSGKPFIFEATRHQQMPHIISCICGRKLMRRGCQAFLASIVTVTEPVSQSLEDLEVVRDFLSVFPDDVSGIPQNREVDFSIDLMPGTVPISKEPYHLAPAEMKELKDQIKDLLDKGFIRSSFSP
ncbi:uncharacterized protein [Primulina huaijiensis]|uniref:uncharacterized protein n=1 Tax=Primulina huaijiensis TaxID=1492673 RepID=UPI003CC761A2